MASIQAQVRADIAAHRMIGPGFPVVVAVSGGPDSLCLLHILASLQDELGVTLHVAHLDHTIRGAESAAEADFVAGAAQHLGLPATVEAVDVPALAREQRENLHAAARAARYAFLARVARAIGAQAVAVAHHADDQAATVLMHLLRGAGPEGLRGMRPIVAWEEWARDRQTGRQADRQIVSFTRSPAHPYTPALIRPLLEVSRSAIERYCAERGLEPRRDPSNLALDATRNRIRHDLLPRLIEYNPHIVAALGRTAAICAGDQAFIESALAAAWPELAREREDGIDFAGAAWRELHPAVQRAALRRAYRLLVRGETLSLERVEQARELVSGGDVGRRCELPRGVTLIVGSGGFSLGTPVSPAGPQLHGEITLPRAGRIELGDGWWIELTEAPALQASPADSWEIALDADALDGQLLVRSRRPGERLRPAGGRGSRRLQDIMVDAKVPRALRAAWPIVATPTAIVWVAGIRAAEGFVATPASRRIVKIRVARDT
jgi:tRNA(Ile)-lysidine synthetase-like protein